MENTQRARKSSKNIKRARYSPTASRGASSNTQSIASRISVDPPNSTDENSSHSDTTFQEIVLNRLDELLFRVSQLEKYAAKNDSRLKSMCTNKPSKAISTLSTSDKDELKKLGLPIVSLIELEKFEESLEKPEFAERVVSYII